MNSPEHRPDRQAAASPPPAIQSQFLTRVVGVIRGFTGLAGVISLSVLAAEAALPASFKPSTLIGGFHGRIEAADATAKAGPVSALTRQNAEAASQPPAFAGMETAAFQAQQQVLAGSLQMQSTIANTADASCAGSKLIPQHDRDWGWLGGLLSLGCGVGDQVRQDMMRTLRRGGQDNSVLIQRPRAGGDGAR